jgi:pimeloyl-ACP methyl ester carboxylesterase
MPGRTKFIAGVLCAIVLGAGAAVLGETPGSPLAYERVEVPAQAAATDGMVNVGDVRLRYWDTGGSGEVVVLLHPGTGSALGWEYQQPDLARAGYRVIGYSRRGHAGSEVGPTESPPAAADLLKLLDALKVARFHAVGVAAGGIYATDFALSHPNRVLSLTIAGSIVAVADAAYMKRSGALRPAAFNGLPSEFRELGPQYRAGYPEGVARWLDIERANAIDPAAQASARPALANKLTLEALTGLRMPVLLVTGDADLYTPPALMRELQQAIPRSRAQVIDGAGHSAHWEQPRAFNALLLDFLASAKRP